MKCLQQCLAHSEHSQCFSYCSLVLMRWWDYFHLHYIGLEVCLSQGEKYRKNQYCPFGNG